MATSLAMISCHLLQWSHPQHSHSTEENISISVPLKLCQNFWTFLRFCQVSKYQLKLVLKSFKRKQLSLGAKSWKLDSIFNQILWMAHCVIWLKNNFSRIITFVYQIMTIVTLSWLDIFLAHRFTKYSSSTFINLSQHFTVK